MADYLVTVDLPSNGMLYGEDVVTQFTLKAMGTKEEKMLFGSTSDDAFDRVLKSCIVEPKNFQLDNLISADKHFLMMKLRIHTYGSAYHVSAKCPNCNSRDSYEINLDEFNVDTLETPVEPIEITLPVCGDKLSLKLLRGSDLNYISRQAKKLSRTLKVKQSELEYTMRMARYIKKINDEDIDQGTAQGYVENMHGKDSAYFWYMVDKVKVGYDTTVLVNCDNCGEEVEFLMPINSEFFRPKFD